MHFANLTDTVCPYVANVGEWKKGDMQKTTFIRSEYM
jgi:hypothetical protein